MCLCVCTVMDWWLAWGVSMAGRIRLFFFFHPMLFNQWKWNFTFTQRHWTCLVSAPVWRQSWWHLTVELHVDGKESECFGYGWYSSLTLFAVWEAQVLYRNPELNCWESTFRPERQWNPPPLFKRSRGQRATLEPVIPAETFSLLMIQGHFR